MGIGAIISLVISGITAVVGGVVGGVGAGMENKKKKGQAAQLERNAKRLADLADQGKISQEQALQRIDDMIAKAGGSITTAINNQLAIKSKDLKDQYKKVLDKTSNDLRTSFTQRRIAGGPLAEATGRIAEGLTEQFTSEQRTMYDQAQTLIAQQIANLELSGAQMKEGKIAAGEAFQNDVIMEIMQIENMANELQSTTGPGNIALGAMAGFVGQGGNIANAIGAGLSGFSGQDEPNVADVKGKAASPAKKKIGSKAFSKPTGLLFDQNLETMFS